MKVEVHGLLTAEMFAQTLEKHEEWKFTILKELELPTAATNEEIYQAAIHKLPELPPQLWRLYEALPANIYVEAKYENGSYVMLFVNGHTLQDDFRFVADDRLMENTVRLVGVKEMIRLSNMLETKKSQLTEGDLKLLNETFEAVKADTRKLSDVQIYLEM